MAAYESQANRDAILALDILPPLLSSLGRWLECLNKTSALVALECLRKLVYWKDPDWNKLQYLTTEMKTLSKSTNGRCQATACEVAKLLLQNGMFTMGDESQNLDVCKVSVQIYNTRSVLKDDVKRKEVLKNLIYFITVSPLDHRREKISKRVSAKSYTSAVPYARNLLELFHGESYLRMDTFNQFYGILCRDSWVFEEETREGRDRWTQLEGRVREHSVIIARNWVERPSEVHYDFGDDEDGDGEGQTVVDESATDGISWSDTTERNKLASALAQRI
ncbi:hypothetical protein HDV00_006682 [Rhizophlyctis rosea]|nr:hypothetical protein HDV00_006682 [Rhizophlyctis rosea]